MAYYTGVYSPIQPFKLEIKIYEDEDGFSAYQWHGRYYLVKDGYQIGEIIGGEEGFLKNYKGDFKKWINSIKAKDEKKLAGIEDKIKQLKSDTDLINSIWK